MQTIWHHCLTLQTQQCLYINFMKRTATAQWSGSLKDGSGALTTESEVLHNTPYSFSTRFEDVKGTNPEELVAAAHASCFTMAFAAELLKVGLVPKKIQVDSYINLEKTDSGWEVNEAHLKVYAFVPEGENDYLKKCAEKVRENCPISKLLNTRVTMETELEGKEPLKPGLQETG